MPPGVPVATVGLDGSLNAGILAAQILSVGDDELSKRVLNYKQGLKQKIIKANNSLSKFEFKFRTN
jgi:5-(carboxyamino)imidazole ribonucleotide mutase